MRYREFVETVHKGSDENYLIDKYFFRKISAPGSFVMGKTGISPNTVTFLSLVCSLSAVWFFMKDDALSQCVACGLVFTYHYLDHIDGELARFYAVRDGRRGGLAGSYFDVLCHSYSVNLWLIGVTFALFQRMDSLGIALLGVVAVAGTNSFPRLIGFKILGLQLGREPDVLASPAGEAAIGATNERQRQIGDVQAGLLTRRGMIKLAKELVGYPGMILLVILAVLVDVVADSTAARVALLALLAAAHVTNSILTARKLMRHYAKVV